MATILAHIRVKPGGEARFEAIARDLFRSTHDTEDDVRRYEYWRGSEPRSYYTLLAFDDFRSFIAHQTSEHHESASPALGSVIESLRLEWVDPVDGACDLPATEHQDPAPGSGELTMSYSERFAAQIAPWWDEVRPTAD